MVYTPIPQQVAGGDAFSIINTARTNLDDLNTRITSANIDANKLIVGDASNQVDGLDGPSTGVGLVYYNNGVATVFTVPSNSNGKVVSFNASNVPTIIDIPSSVNVTYTLSDTDITNLYLLS